MMRTFLEAWRRLDTFEKTLGAFMLAAFAGAMIAVAWRIAR
jgi:hypothetical protein